MVIEVNNIGKKYNITHSRDRYVAFRDVLADMANLPAKIIGKRAAKEETKEEFWALRNISFGVQKGEVLGIIGPNGAGKSTLLKILSRITSPTEGTATIRGRVGSLLEVGTGFHPELTGRENIYLNGAILGMSRKEVSEKFDKIVEFSGVERFIDTPVKRYSSGMYVRLAFSVAAHLEPDILLVDEVLAVGDAEFQKKCLGRMSEVTKNEGRTILFVSHNMAAVQNLCDRCILLDKGMIQMIGDPEKVIAKYIGNRMSESKISVKDRTDRKGSGEAKIVDAWVSKPSTGRSNDIFLENEAFTFHINVESEKDLEFPGMAIGVYNSLNQCIFWLDSRALQDKISLKKGINKISCRLTAGYTPVAGAYTVNIALFGKTADYLDYITDACVFNIIDGDFYGTGRKSGGRPMIFVEQRWSAH